MTPGGTPAPSAAALANGLPALWDVRKDRTGRIYYINHVTKSTQWNDPRPFPEGWERKFDEARKLPYFVNHRAKSTQWQDPRPPIVFPDESKASDGGGAAAFARTASVSTPSAAGGGYGSATLPRNFNPSALPVAQPVPNLPNLGRSVSMAVPPPHSNGHHQMSAPTSSPGPGGVPSGTGDREWYKQLLKTALADKCLSPGIPIIYMHLFSYFH